MQTSAIVEITGPNAAATDLATVWNGDHHLSDLGQATDPLCQGSCPLLYFSSISQVGGIGR